jgi:alkylation response protein AidB-like acyl-CoA dehydrogenase
MNFSLTEDQRAIQDSARRFLDETAPPDRLRRALEDPAGFDATLWAEMTRELGWAGIAIPEAYGGAGLGAMELALLLEEMGRALPFTPFFETAALAAQLILAAGDEAQKANLLGPIAAGELRAAVSMAGPDGRIAPKSFGATLWEAGPHWRLNGKAPFVAFGHVADLLLVAAAGRGAGFSLVAIPSSTPGVTIRREQNLDLTRPYSTIHFDDVPVERDQILGEPGGATASLTHALTLAAGLLAAEQTGGAARCLDDAVDYAKQRIQFGRPIGAFQAVKHKLADMMLLVEASRSAAYYAAAAIDAGGSEAQTACSVAKAYCSDAYYRCAADAIQVHGGIGFTWEHHAHLYFRRARASAAWLGDADAHREQVGSAMGLDALTAVDFTKFAEFYA